MRRGIFGLLLMVASPSLAVTKIDGVTRQYNDGKTKVFSPHLDVSSTFFGDRAQVGLGYAMDILTSSSSDVKSFGSQEISENRKEYSGNLGFMIPSGSVGIGYVQSDENDYNSKIYSLSSSREFFEKNTVLGLGFASGSDVVRSSADPAFERGMGNQSYSFSLTQILSKISLMQFLYDFRLEHGYLASPYRRARLLQPDGSVLGVPEVHPQSRGRNSLAIKYNHHLLGPDISTASSFRLYFDTWGVQSSTFEERLTRRMGRIISLSLNFRFYQQNPASFYKDKYERLPSGFVSGNKTLASYYSTLIGLRPTVHISDKLQFFLKGEYYIQKFQDHTDVGDVADPNDDAPLELQAITYGFGFNGTF